VILGRNIHHKSFLQFNKLNISSSDFKPVQYNNDVCFSLKSRWFMLSRDQSVILILVAKLKSGNFPINLSISKLAYRKGH
jgi:hypothetical protein